MLDPLNKERKKKEVPCKATEQTLSAGEGRGATENADKGFGCW